MSSVVVRDFGDDDRNHFVDLILSIQRQEFGLSIAANDQPDLAAIPDFYQTGACGFWVAALDTALAHARAHAVSDIYLGTTDRFLAAHRFYEKTGFTPVAPESLPPAFHAWR